MKLFHSFSCSVDGYSCILMFKRFLVKYRVAVCRILFPIKYSVAACQILFPIKYRDRKSTRLNSSHSAKSRMPSSA